MVELYRTNSDKRTVSKALQAVASVNNVIKHSLDSRNPYVILDTKYAANYAKIEGKYYYIENITTDTGHRFTYSLRCDVLMTYKSDILNSFAVCNRRSSFKQGARYLSDPLAHVMENRKNTTTIVFDEEGKGFNDSGKFILITCGG